MRARGQVVAPDVQRLAELARRQHQDGTDAQELLDRRVKVRVIAVAYAL